MKKVACYVRVSHEEQARHGISVDSQIEALTQYCKDNKYHMAGVYNDAGISARKSYKNRPALLQLIADCKAGKIDLIIFTKLDRWFRSVADYYEVQRIIDEYGVKWRCIWEDYETETSSGVFKVNIMLSVAQSEADRTSERIKKVFEYKKAKGEVCSGAVAWGYKIENKKWIKDKEAEPLVNEFFDTFLSTLSRRQTQIRMYELGHPMGNDTLSKMLRNKAYYGGSSYVTEPYITMEQHEKIVKTFRNNMRVNKYTYMFSGLCICGKCGYKLNARRTLYKAKRKEDNLYIGYMCSNHNRNPEACVGTSIKESVIENYLIENLDKKLHDYYIEAVCETPATDDIQNKINNINSRLKRLRDLYELGDIDIEEYKIKRDELQTQLNKLESTQPQNPPQLPHNWIDIYNELDTIHRKSFWVSIIDHIVVNDIDSKELEVFFV